MLSQIDGYKGSYPKTLLRRLQRVTPNAKDVQFQIFKGISNPDIYCYVISFFQLFFHCPKVIRFFENDENLNDTEILLNDIIKDIYKKNSKTKVLITDFIANWTHWDGKNHLPAEQRDVREFIDNFFPSLSEQLSSQFSFIKTDYFEKDVPIYKSYILNCLSKKIDVQENINERIKECYKIHSFNDYFLISLQRNFLARRKSIKINSFIQIDSQIFRFVGAVIYNGNSRKGHFTTILKICQHYFYFDDDDVFSLFPVQNSPSFTNALMQQCEKCLHTDSTLLLYVKNTGKYDLNKYESIMNQNDHRVQITQVQKMRTTLKKIKNINLLKNKAEEEEREKNQSNKNDAIIVEPSDYQNKNTSDEENEQSNGTENENSFEAIESSDYQITSDEERENEQSNDTENENSFETIESSDYQKLFTSDEEKENEQSNDTENENSFETIESSDYQKLFTSDEEKENEQSNEKSQYISNRPLSIKYQPDISSSSDENSYFSCPKIMSTCSEPRATLLANERTVSSLSQLPKTNSIHSTPRLNSCQKHFHKAIANNSQLIITPNLLNDEDITKNGEKSKIGNFQHCDLQREIVDVETIDDNLSGIVYINKADPVNNPQKQTKSKHAILRKLFKSTGNLLRILQYTDQGNINADILKNYLHIHNEEDDEIKKKGEELYQILNNFYESGNYTYSELKNQISPIVDWYKLKYGSKIVPSIDDDLIINDDIGMILNLSDTEPEDEDISYRSFLAMIDSIIEISSDDDDNDPDFDANITLKKTPLRNIFSRLEMSELENRANAEISIIFEDDGHIETETSVHLYTMKDPNAKISLHLAHTLDEMLHIRRYQDLLSKDLDESKITYENDPGNDDDSLDDNNFPIRLYNWKERSRTLDVDEIFEVIKEVNGPNYENDEDIEFLMDVGLAQLWERIQHDVVQLYVTMKPKFIKPFVKDFIEANNVEHPPNIHVRAYRKLKEKKRSKKTKTDTEEEEETEKGNEPKKAWCGVSTLQNLITTFNNNYSAEEQQEYLNYNNEHNKRGGKRDEITKVTKETLKCLITLVLDFPTLSSFSYMTYINSQFGPNYTNNISERTVQRYLSSLNFKLKKVYFSPPNRNSVGLRIFRVAWSKILEKIASEENVLIGFVDEASVGGSEGKRYGKSFIGITPLMNSILSKVKMTTMAVVFPGFGVLYKIKDKSIKSEDYSEFIREVIQFCRKYLCNNNTEIILIEDNCPTHSTLTVENLIDELKFALIPIVPYSPSLNGVVESYFGFIKLHDFVVTFLSDDQTVKLNIIKNWKEITYNEYKIGKSIKFFKEWIYRLQACKRGEPIYSEHCYPEPVQFDFNKLCNVSVSRFYK